MLVGDMRVASDTDRQTTDLQRDALLDAGVDLGQLFADKGVGCAMIALASSRRSRMCNLGIASLCGSSTDSAAPSRISFRLSRPCTHGAWPCAR
jgi:hypothetical protein